MEYKYVPALKVGLLDTLYRVELDGILVFLSYSKDDDKADKFLKDNGYTSREDYVKRNKV